MNKKFGLFCSLMLTLSVAFSSCNSDDELVGNWVATTTDFAGKARGDAASFTIGNKLYIFGGYNGKTRFNDLWVLDVQSGSSATVGTWTQLADLDASTATVTDAATANYGRNNAVGFAIGSNGYIGSGYNENYLKDFWKYDPTSNSWSQVANLPAARLGAFAFALGSTGYVGGGYDENYLSDFYSYNPTTNEWTSVAFGGRKRAHASTFVVGNTAYVVGGYNSSGHPTDFWAFDGKNWTAKRRIANVTDESFDDDYGSIARQSASAFVINGKAYLACGYTNNALVRTTWEYNPSDDTWSEKNGFEATARASAIGAGVNGRGLVLTGKTGSSYLDDVNEFFPSDSKDSND